MILRGAWNMERISPDGQRRPASAGEVAGYDQMEARYNDLSARMLAVRAKIRIGAKDNNTAAISAATHELGELCKAELPGTDGDGINLIMFLLHLVEQAGDWTEKAFTTVDAVMRQMATLLPHMHEVFEIPNWDREILDRETEVAQAAVDALHTTEMPKPGFTTDTGDALLRVHSEADCDGAFCTVHRPAPGPWSSWPTHWKDDWRLMVRICPHGVEHVAIEEMLRMPLLSLISHDHPAECDCPCDFSRCTTLTDEQGQITGFRANA